MVRFIDSPWGCGGFYGGCGGFVARWVAGGYFVLWIGVGDQAEGDFDTDACFVAVKISSMLKEWKMGHVGKHPGAPTLMTR